MCTVFKAAVRERLPHAVLVAGRFHLAQLASTALSPARLVFPPVLFLIDRRGQIAQPVIPTGGCGQPLQQILIAVQRVPWVTVHAATPAQRVNRLR
jgi:hypothetical protein